MPLTLRGRFFWLAGVVLLLAGGYTAGYLLAPPPPAAISLSVPESPVEVPSPDQSALETIEDA